MFSLVTYATAFMRNIAITEVYKAGRDGRDVQRSPTTNSHKQ
jgi:hypothetical protein